MQLAPNLLDDLSTALDDQTFIVDDQLCIPDLESSIRHDIADKGTVAVEQVVHGFRRHRSCARQQPLDVDGDQVCFGPHRDAPNITAPQGVTDSTGTTIGSPSQAPKSKRAAWPILLATVVPVLVILLTFSPESDIDHEYRYSEFLGQLNDGAIATAELASDGVTTGELTDDTRYRTRIPIELSSEDLLSRLKMAE